MIDRVRHDGWTWTREPPTTWEGDAEGLGWALARASRGAVGFGLDRAKYAHDASNDRQRPISYVRPIDAQELLAALAVCRESDAPVLARGGGTSLAGQTVNLAVVLDCSRHMTRVLELDPARRLARVQPGTVLDDLRDQAVRHHLTSGPDAATHEYCALGGNDRQQRLRRARPADGPRGGQRRGAGGGHLRRSCAARRPDPRALQGTGRSAVHLAEVLRLGLTQAAQAARGPRRLARAQHITARPGCEPGERR